MRKFIFLGLLVCSAAQAQEPEVAATFGPFEVRGDAASYLDLGVGAFDVLGEGESDFGIQTNRSAVGRVELRGGEKFYGIGPVIGILGNTDGGIYGYGGLYADIAWGDVVFTPMGAIGGYRQGDSKPLGGVFQFRLSLGVSYEFDDASRVGVSFAHISNAYIHEANPGEEEILLTYQLPF